MATEIGDLNIIQDEDTLRRMWQETEDFSRKKEIRLRMYRLREERLKSYYITRETTTNNAVPSGKAITSSHADSLSDQGFSTMKAKEIRDSASPTLDIKQSNASRLSTKNHSEQLADQNIISSSQQMVESGNFSSSGSLNNHQSQDQTSSTATSAYETSTIPYNMNNTGLVSYDNQDIHSNQERSIKSVKSSSSEKYYTSSKREVIKTSTSSEKSQQKVISDNYNVMSQHANNQNTISDNADCRIEYTSNKMNDHSSGNLVNNTSHQSQQAIEFYDTNVSNAKIPDTIISTSQHTIQEHNYLRSAPEQTVTKDSRSTGNTVSYNNYETNKSTNRTLESKSSTNKISNENQHNVDHNIMNELHKLDSYLSTEAVNISPVPSSPASSYTSETLAVDRNIDSKAFKQFKPSSSPTVSENTDHLTTYQQAYSKISTDTSATHNAFASSLRASPDRGISSPGRRTPSRSSLDRSTPDKSPRISPEKNLHSDLSRKYTASFQNRVSRNSTHMRDSKSSSPTKSVELRYRKRSSSSSSESDSDDSHATYDTKGINSTSIRSSSNKHTKAESINSIRTINENRYSSPTKSSGHTSEGSVEREVGKIFCKSPGSSPERSAFKPVTINDSYRTKKTEEQGQSQTRIQTSPLKKSPDICSVESFVKHQSSDTSSKRQLSPRNLTPTQQPTTPTRKQSTSKENTVTSISSIETTQKNTSEIRKQPSKSTISSPPQSSPKRQSSPQIISNNICTVENTANRNQSEMKRQSSPQINVTTEQIYKPEPKRHPSLQTVVSTSNANIHESINQTEVCIHPVLAREPIEPSRRESQHKIYTIRNTHITDTVDHKQTEIKNQICDKSTVDEKPLKSNKYFTSQKISINNNTSKSNAVQDIIVEKQKQLPSSPVATTTSEYNKHSVNSQGPKKPKRQPSGQTNYSTTTSTVVSAEMTDQIIGDVQKSTSPSSPSKPSPISEVSSNKTSTASKKISETERITYTDKVAKKKSPRKISPEKVTKENTTEVVESVEVVITDQTEPPNKLQLRSKTKKKPTISPIVDGRVVDVNEEDVTEEIKVKLIPTNSELHLKNNESKVKSIISADDSVKEKKLSKVPVVKQRSASYNDFTTPRKPKSTSIKVLADESTDESSSSSESSSEEECEEVVIEEIFDEFGTPIPRETNPLEAALRLEAVIKSKEEVDLEQQATKDIKLIPEDEVNLKTKNQSETFIQQEKIIQEGDEDDCLPPIEQVLGKDVDKAALNDFLEWERNQSLHKHTHPSDIESKAQEKFITGEKQTHKLKTEQQVIQPVQPIKKEEKLTNRQQPSRSNLKVKPADINKPLTDKKSINKISSDKKLVKEYNPSIATSKSPVKKLKEITPSTPSKLVTKHPSNKDIIPTRKTVNTSPRIVKQNSDRSLKEKNEKLQSKKLDREHKTKSEIVIKPTKSSNLFQRRSTDYGKTNIVQRTETNSSFNKENRDILGNSKVISKDSPQIVKTVLDIKVTKNISKLADKPVSKHIISTSASSTIHKIPQKTLSNKSISKDKVTITCKSPAKPAKAQSKPSSRTPTSEKVVERKPKISKEHIEESSTSVSSSSVEDLQSESITTTTISTTVHADQHNTNYIEKELKQKNKIQQKQQTLVEPRDTHLNVVVRMPSSSRETTPNKQPDDRFYPVTTDDNDDIPRYADRVTSPDDVELPTKRKYTNLSTFEKITDLDEEEETSDTDLTNVSVAERMTKFLESAKETTANKQTTIVEDDIFQNRELAVSKTKEMFETIAKGQAPGSSSIPITKPPPVINRPSVFEAGATVLEYDHDGAYKTISKKLTEEDYEDYLRECKDGTRVNITEITRSFEDRAAENTKNIVNTKSKKEELLELSSNNENSALKTKQTSRETSPIKSPISRKNSVESTKNSTFKISSINSEDSKCNADFCTTLSHTKPNNIKESPNPASSCTSPIPEERSQKQISSPPVISPRSHSPNKEQPGSSNPATISSTKEVDKNSKSIFNPLKTTSPTKDTGNRSPSPMRETFSSQQKLHPNKPILIHDSSNLPHNNQFIAPEVKHVSNTTMRNNSKGDVIQSTTHRYEINRKSPTTKTVLQQPIEITEVEVRPSKQVYEHTAITNVHNTRSKFTPIEETFNQKLTRYSDNVSSSLTKSTESSKRKAGKSPSPEKAPFEITFTPRKLPSPPKEVIRKTTSNISNSSGLSLKRQKSPSPEKTTNKLRNKFQANSTTVETKKKKFEKRLSTTGTDYQNRKKFFETNAGNSKPKQLGTTTKYEITVKSTSRSEKSPPRHSPSKSPERVYQPKPTPPRRSQSKSPERVYQPKLETTRKVTKETTTSSRTESRISPTKTIITTTTTTTSVQPKHTSSPERSSHTKRTSPEKVIKKVPFGVTLRQSTAPSSTTVIKQTQRVEADHCVEELTANGKKIEEIFDLELLERLLERAVQYDLRSRIRAQIRLVKRQLETSKNSRTPSPEKSSPTRKTKISTTSQSTPRSASSPSRSEVDGRVSGSSLERRDKARKRLFTDERTSTSSESRSHFTGSSTPSDHNGRPRNGSPVRISERNELNQSTYQSEFGSAPTSANGRKSATMTESIISGYGLGPTDGNGRPLFGLKALRASSETKIADQDLDKPTQVKTDYEREITDNSGRPLFGIKALQKSSNFAENQSKTVSSERQSNRKIDENRSVTTESRSHVYSTRTAMKSDSSGNVSVYRDEVKGELFSKDGKEPTGKMTSTRYAYHKPEGEEATVKTESTSSYLNSKSHSSDANRSGDQDGHDKWRSSPGSKLGSSSLIRKISNEHFEKAQRKFSSGDEATTTWNEAWNEAERKASVDSTSKYETSSSSRAHRSLAKVDSSEKFHSQRYSTESSSTRRESYDDQAERAGEYGKVHSVSSSVYGQQSNGDQPRVSRNDSFKEVKSKFQQATVSSSMKNVSKSPDGRTSPPKLQTTRRSPDMENTGTQSSFSSHKTKSNNQSSDGSYYYETRSYTESSSTNSHDLLNRVKDGGSRPRSEYTDEEKEAASLLDKLVGKSVSLRELESVPKTSSSTESIVSKAATLVQKFEKQQNKTKQNKEEINVEQIWDELQLRDLLEASTDYESRRQIRARLRAIMAENKADADVVAAPETADSAPKNDTSPTRTETTSRSDSTSTTVTKVQSKTSSTSRISKANSVTSPFSKFRQLERQNSLPSSAAPTTKIANPNLTRSATSIKDRLLNWVKAQTKEYENVQIDNFSTSWNNGLAFCALIHHFCPHAFDYNKLTPDQRRHNFELAFRVAEEEAGIVPLLDVEDMVAMLRPDWKCVFTYVQSVYQRFRATSAAVRPTE